MFHFYKYQGTGNDFVIIDAIAQPDAIMMSAEQRAFICDRKFGIGADGLILFTHSEISDFRMLYYNADGNESTMCGNGGRCISLFANTYDYVKEDMRFEAIDGIHESKVTSDKMISLQMQDVDKIKKIADNDYELDTGSPHFVHFDSKGEKDIVDYGKEIRYSPRYSSEGINVNVVTLLNNNKIRVSTYERGVEDETLSCGTGVTACALATMSYDNSFHNKSSIAVKTKGGELEVKFKTKDNTSFTQIFLCGPAQEVFQGYIHLQT